MYGGTSATEDVELVGLGYRTGQNGTGHSWIPGTAREYSSVLIGHSARRAGDESTATESRLPSSVEPQR